MSENDRSLEQEWCPRWIWVGSHVSTRNCYIYARHEFSLGRITSARARVACASHYRLFVNGRYVGRGPCASTGTVQYYDEHDLSHVLRRGKNVIAALCYNEMVDTATRPAYPAGLACRVEIVDASGVNAVETDEQWRVRIADDYDQESPWISPSLGFCEHYDSRHKPVGWNVVGYDDTGWENASLVDHPSPHLCLLARPIPLLREQERFPERVTDSGFLRSAESILSSLGDAASAGPGEDAWVTVDFGQEIVGHPILRIRDGGHAVVVLWYGLSEPAGADMIQQSDRVTLHGGRREWQAFGRRTFRYLTLSIRELDAPLQIESVSVTSVGYPVEQVTTFECGDEALNQAWHDGLHGLNLCMQDTYESDPATDPIQRPSQARAMALANYHCFFDSLLAAKAVREFAGSGTPDYAWISMLHDYYLYTADQSLVDELYRSIRPLLDLPQAHGDYDALRDAAKLSAACGQVHDVIAWHELAEKALNSPDQRSSPSLFDELAAAFREGRAAEALDRIRRSNAVRRTDTVGAVYFLIADVLGVRPSVPGSPVVVIQPRPGDLAWARGSVQTHKGPVQVEWRSEVDSFEIDIEAPYGFIAALPIGRFRNPIVDEIDTSPETPERRAQRTYGWGSTIWRNSEEHDPYLDWLEGQEAEPTPDYVRRMRCSREADYLWVRECSLTQVRYIVRESRGERI